MDTLATVGKDLPDTRLSVEVDFYWENNKIASFHELSLTVVLLFHTVFLGHYDASEVACFSSNLLFWSSAFLVALSGLCHWRDNNCTPLLRNFTFIAKLILFLISSPRLHFDTQELSALHVSLCSLNYSFSLFVSTFPSQLHPSVQYCKQLFCLLDGTGHPPALGPKAGGTEEP